MSQYQPPIFEPDCIVAGDNVQWNRGIQGYTPSNWMLSYTFVSATANPINITATDNGDGTWLVSVPAATTTGWTPGFYQWQAYITNGTERHSVLRGRCTIKPNFAAQNAAFDPRSSTKITLDALIAMIQGKASSDQASYSINGRSLARMKPEELIKWYQFYETLYEREVQAERIVQGRTGPGKVMVRFNDPSTEPLINPQLWYKGR